ncbi:MAG: hypothetical protein ABII13_04685 [Patescibacteria group bacterium]
MIERQRSELEATPKSILRLNRDEVDIPRLHDFLRSKGFDASLYFPELKNHGADSYVRPIQAQMNIDASYNDLREALESSDEFKQLANKILGSV